MKKVKKPYVKRYPALRLYIDDLEEIVGIFKSHFTDIKIVADEYELTDIADINNIKKPLITDFSVSYNQHNQDPSRSGLLSLDLKPDHASIYLSDSEATYLCGVASQIDALLLRKKSVAGFMASHRLIRFSLIVYIPFMIALLLLSFIYHFVLWNILLFILTMIYLVWSNYTISIIDNRYCIIFLVNSNNKNNYFSRNKDQLISAFINIFFLILGSVLTYLVMNFLFHK